MKKQSTTAQNRRELAGCREKPASAFYIPLGRRRFLKSIAAASAGFALPGYLAEALTVSPMVTQGPYYPLASNIPLDKDNDLVQLNDNLSAASGIITYVSGRVLDNGGNPVRGALVELWHADNGGNYIYSTTSARNSAADPNFQGFGQFLTGSSGRFLFRTVKAGLYVGRTRHYHWGVTLPGKLSRSTTQTFWNETAYDLSGNAWATQNSNDNVYSTITDAAERASILLTYTAVPGTTTGEVQASWDFVSQYTPVEPTYPNGGSLTVAGTPVTAPAGGNNRFKISIPAYTGYTYEVYGNPTMANLGWAALPFSLSQTGTIDRNEFTATADGNLDLYVEQKATKGFYFVSFRVPGANTGTP
jgi:protocatechuate 3,4-dioxygenase beta subunit